MKQSAENDTPKRRVATTMSATNVTKRSWIDLSSMEVFKRGTKDKSRRKPKFSMTRQNSQNSSFRLSHDLVKVVSDETSSNESDGNCSDQGDSLSLPSDGSSLRSCTVEGMSFVMGSKGGSSYVNFDAVPRTPYQEEKSRWSRESRGRLKMQNNPFLKTKNSKPEEIHLYATDRDLKYPPPINRITEPLPHGSSFLADLSSTKTFCEAFSEESQLLGMKHEIIEDINQSDLCAISKHFISTDNDSKVSLSPSESQNQARIQTQAQAAIASLFSLSIKSQEHETETDLVCDNDKCCVDEIVTSECCDGQALSEAIPIVADRHKIYSSSSAAVVDTERRDIDPTQVMRSTPEPIVRRTTTVNSGHGNVVDESINSDPCFEATEYGCATSDSDSKHQPTVQVVYFSPFSVDNVNSPDFIKTLDEAATSTTACSATTISEKTPNSCLEALEKLSKTSKSEPCFDFIVPVSLPHALTSGCYDHTSTPRAPDNVDCLNNVEQVVLQPIQSSEAYTRLEPNLDHEMNITTADDNEPASMMSETQEEELDVRNQQIACVADESGRILTSEQSLISHTREGPMVAENDSQQDESFMCFQGMCKGASSDPTIDSANPLIEIPSPSNNKSFVKEPAEKSGPFMPSVPEDQILSKIQRCNEKQTAYASIATIVVQPEPAPYWRIDSSSQPRLALDDLSEPTSFRAYPQHSSDHSNRITPITRKVSARHNNHITISKHQNPPKNVVTFAPSISSGKSRFHVIQCKNLNSGLSFLSSSKNTKPHNLNEQVRGTSRSTTQRDHLSSIAGSNVRGSSPGCIVRVYD